MVQRTDLTQYLRIKQLQMVCSHIFLPPLCPVAHRVLLANPSITTSFDFGQKRHPSVVNKGPPMIGKVHFNTNPGGFICIKAAVSPIPSQVNSGFFPSFGINPAFATRTLYLPLPGWPVPVPSISASWSGNSGKFHSWHA